jgi:hypothetical protein
MAANGIVQYEDLEDLYDDLDMGDTNEDQHDTDPGKWKS